MTELQVLQEIKELLEARPPVNEVMDIKSGAAYLGVSENFFRALIDFHHIPYVQLKTIHARGRIVVRKTDLDSFLEAQLVRGPADLLKLNDGRTRGKRCS